MSKRMLINYLLLILIIICTWIGINYPIRQDQLINRHAITPLKPQDITEIKVETADATIRLEKRGASWRILSPIDWFANNIAAERLTTLVSLEPRSKLPKDQIELSTLGLRIPKAVLTLNDKSFFFGDTNRIGNRRYLMLEPNVYLSDDIHYAFISQGLTGLVDSRLLPAQIELQSLIFNGFGLHKEAAGWSSDNAANSTEDSHKLISNWRQMQASRIKTLDNSLDPLHKIKAVLTNGSEIEFFLLSIQPEIIIARPDLKLQYHFPDQRYYDLLAIKPAQQPLPDQIPD